MIKAIETYYNGYRFRSRTEARWAVFFDTLKIPYEYEKQGYDLGKGLCYLPDFWLPQQEIFIEIKPLIYDKDNNIKFPKRTKEDKLEKQINFPVITICGTPGEITDPDSHSSGPYMCFPKKDIEHYWCECEECNILGIQYMGWSGRNKHKEWCLYKHVDRKNQNINSPRLLEAYNEARSKRFEFEEKQTEIKIDLQPYNRNTPKQIKPFQKKRQKVKFIEHNKKIPGLDTYK